MTTFFTSDVSSFQETLVVNTLKKNGCSGIMVKCTQGTAYVNPDYKNKLHQAKAAFMPFLAYHFLEHGNVQAQAKNLADHIIDKSIPVMVDFEPTKYSHPTWVDLTTFLKFAKEEGLDVRAIYYPGWYWSQTGTHSLVGKPALVQSAYPLGYTSGYGSVLYGKCGGAKGSGWNIMGGVRPTFWQFTSSGKLSGYSGLVDFSAFEGSHTDFLKYFKDFSKKPVARRRKPAKNIVQALHYLYLSKRWARAHKKHQRVIAIQKEIVNVGHLK